MRILTQTLRSSLNQSERVFALALPDSTLTKPLTAKVLQGFGVPSEFSEPKSWQSVKADPKNQTSSHAFEDRGVLLAQACPGVVFMGKDISGYGNCGKKRLDWKALPGPHTPTGSQTLSLSEQRPTFKDGLSFVTTKVTVWAMVGKDPNAPCVPTGYHVEAGVFDDSDILGLDVNGWLPLGPQPALKLKRKMGAP